jgi:hypothetical protein
MCVACHWIFCLVFKSSTKITISIRKTKKSIKKDIIFFRLDFLKFFFP